MMVAVDASWPTPLPHLCAALSGSALPQTGSCVRARWSHLVPDKRMLQTAFAFEAVVDEAVFVIGPTLVTLLATTVHPLAGLTTAILAGLAGTAVLVSLRTSEPPPTHGLVVHVRGTMGWNVLGPMTVCAFALGVLFGGCEVATVAFADELGAKSVSGVMLAIWSLGSLLSGVVTGALQLTAPHAVRFRWGLLALGLLMVPLPFVNGFWLLGLFLFLAGFAISPTLIASVAWIEQTVPATRITEGITIVTTGLAAGVAPGAAVVGFIVDRYGASASYWVPAAAGLGGAAVAFAASTVTAGMSSPTGSSV
jgi:predicted MFS family arabinose efflux permease